MLVVVALHTGLRCGKLGVELVAAVTADAVELFVGRAGLHFDAC